MKRAIVLLMFDTVCMPYGAHAGSKAPHAGAAHWMTDRQATFETLADRYFKKQGARVLFESRAPSDLCTAAGFFPAARENSPQTAMPGISLTLPMKRAAPEPGTIAA